MNKDQLKQLEANLWRAADSLRANSDLNASEYAAPVLGLIFLKFADNKYRQFEAAILAEYHKRQGNRYEKKLSDIAIEQCGIYLSDHARYSQLHKGQTEHCKLAVDALDIHFPPGMTPSAPQITILLIAACACFSWSIGLISIYVWLPKKTRRSGLTWERDLKIFRQPCAGSRGVRVQRLLLPWRAALAQRSHAQSFSARLRRSASKPGASESGSPCRR